MDRKVYGLMVLAVFSIAGCRGTTPVLPPRPTVQVPPPPPAPPNPLFAHLEGAWWNLEKRDRPASMTFEAGGRLVFKGGFEFYNPGQWTLIPEHQTLIITLPAADVDRLHGFQLAVGDGVQAFDPVRKQITYHFDMQTASLNIAGWSYTRKDETIIHAAPQPPLE